MRGKIQSLRRLFPPACKASTVRAMARMDLDMDPSAAVSRRLSLGYRLTALRDTHHEARQETAIGLHVTPWHDAASLASISKGSSVSEELLDAHRKILQDMTSVVNEKLRVDQAEVPEKMCRCGGGVCKVWTAATARNAGRKFYKCPLKKDEGHCGFFQWCDGSSSTSPRVSKEDGESLTHSELPLCPCGAGACVKLTAKTEKNMGRQFYRCPLGQEERCSFFKWCDEMMSPSNATTVKQCHKCGMDDHWAKDCFLDNQVFENSTPFDQRERRDTEMCFKCGLVGHWAKDCPNQQFSNGSKGATEGLNGGSLNPCGYGNPTAKGEMGMGHGSGCFRCGHPGHWAKDCPMKGPSSSGQGFSSKKIRACSCCF